MTEKEVKIQQERIEKFNKLKKELTPYKDMIKFIDNFSNSYQKLIIGITSGEFYITKTNYYIIIIYLILSFRLNSLYFIFKHFSIYPLT